MSCKYSTNELRSSVTMIEAVSCNDADMARARRRAIILTLVDQCPAERHLKSIRNTSSPPLSSCAFCVCQASNGLQAYKIAVPRFEGFDSAMSSTDELHAVQIARAFCDHTRFLIYRHIAEVNEMRCQDICLGTAVCASTVSHHLRILSESGLIESRREGQAVYYRMVPEGLRSYLKFLRTLERKEQELRKTSSVTSVRTPS